MGGEPNTTGNQDPMKIQITAQNIKCGGCAAAITNGLLEDSRIEKVEVDVPTGLVTVEAEGDIRPEIETRLSALGYPPKP